MKALLIALLTAGLTTQAFAGEPAAKPVRANTPTVTPEGHDASPNTKTPTIANPTTAGSSAVGNMVPLYIGVGLIGLGAIVVGTSSSNSGNTNATGAGGTTGTTGT